jgi:predicted protein tyrosine phosphatase
MKIDYMSRRAIEKWAPREKSFLISIRDPGRPEPYTQPGWEGVLRLVFDDLCPEECKAIGRSDLLRTERFFNEDDAQQVADFIKNIEPDSTIVAHCEKGVSRSGAVAQFLFEKFATGGEVPDRKRINPHVYRLLIAATVKN